MIKNTQHISVEAIIEKMKHYCAYQERSQQQVRLRLLKFNINSFEKEQIIAKLIEDNFLNEERFAKALVSGKFNIKHWGRDKILVELRKHKVPEKLSKQALCLINKDNYEKIVLNEITKKHKQIKNENKFVVYNKLMRFAISKGFEHELVKDCLLHYLKITNEV
ncbi:MAG: RecX family transcriptional regulator [Bacteroidetes bacterium]|nr:RecX family transcriptional regulator [Bacteroidota bacterium]